VAAGPRAQYIVGRCLWAQPKGAPRWCQQRTTQNSIDLVEVFGRQERRLRVSILALVGIWRETVMRVRTARIAERVESLHSGERIRRRRRL
jgi:hypothetical protein